MKKHLNLSQLKYGNLAIFYVKLNRSPTKTRKSRKFTKVRQSIVQLPLVVFLHLLKLIESEVDPIKEERIYPIPQPPARIRNKSYKPVVIIDKTNERAKVEPPQEPIRLPGKLLPPEKRKAQAFLRHLGPEIDRIDLGILGEEDDDDLVIDATVKPRSSKRKPKKKKFKQVGLDKFREDDIKREKLLREQCKGMEATLVLELNGKVFRQKIDPASLTLPILEEFLGLDNQVLKN